MKTFFSTFSKRAAFAAAIVVLFISMLAVHAGFVHGMTTSASGTTPIVGTTMIFTPVRGGATTTAITDANGSFTSNILQVGRYTLTISPSVAYTVSLANKTAVPAAFQVWANFNQMKGLLVGGMNATPGATGPINFISDGSLTLSVTFSGKVSGTLTK